MHPTEAFPHFVKAQLRGAAAGADMPYNAVSNDLESVNYSSYKAGMNDARDGFKYLQRVIAFKLMRPWFRDWLKYAMLSGKIPLPMTDYERLAKCDCWKPRRWAGLEPLKEVQAAVLAVEAGFDSQRNIIEEDYDRDIEEVFDEQEHDQALADDHGLDFSGKDIHKPVVGAGAVDTNTEDPEHPDGIKPPGSNGNGNGNGKPKAEPKRGIFSGFRSRFVAS
jgi:lambda family phage portal protein